LVNKYITETGPEIYLKEPLYGVAINRIIFYILILASIGTLIGQ